MRPYLKKPTTKVGLVEWLKVKALSSNPSTKKKKKKNHTVVGAQRKTY
jgi:ribosomal protein S21